MGISEWINIGILLIGFATFLVPLHLDNRRRAQSAADRAKEQAVLLERVWKRLKKHDRRTRKTRQIAADVLQRLHRLETAGHNNHTTGSQS